MKMLQEYWASTVIFIGIFSQCTPLSKHCNWLEIVPLMVQAGSRMFAVQDGPLYIQNLPPFTSAPKKKKKFGT